mmetsp:Transcript_19747/g.39481  ORF Transcript_19747/g.39481 Transcript_19747/m.39481 type:complete len:436 (+) Transcript_19747:1211-2518(+)
MRSDEVDGGAISVEDGAGFRTELFSSVATDLVVSFAGTSEVFVTVFVSVTMGVSTSFFVTGLCCCFDIGFGSGSSIFTTSVFLLGFTPNAVGFILVSSPKSHLIFGSERWGAPKSENARRGVTIGPNAAVGTGVASSCFDTCSFLSSTFCTTLASSLACSFFSSTFCTTLASSSAVCSFLSATFCTTLVSSFLSSTFCTTLVSSLAGSSFLSATFCTTSFVACSFLSSTFCIASSFLPSTFCTTLASSLATCSFLTSTFCITSVVAGSFLTSTFCTASLAACTFFTASFAACTFLSSTFCVALVSSLAACSFLSSTCCTTSLSACSFLSSTFSSDEGLVAAALLLSVDAVDFSATVDFPEEVLVSSPAPLLLVESSTFSSTLSAAASTLALSLVDLNSNGNANFSNISSNADEAADGAAAVSTVAVSESSAKPLA